MTLPESDWCSLGLLTYDTLKVSTLKQGSFILVCASNQNSCAVTLQLPRNTLNTIYFTGSCSSVSKLFSSPETCYFISFVFSQAGRPSQAWCLCFYSWSEKTLGGTKSQVTGSSQEVNAGVILSKEPSFCLYTHKKKQKKWNLTLRISSHWKKFSKLSIFCNPKMLLTCERKAKMSRKSRKLLIWSSIWSISKYVKLFRLYIPAQSYKHRCSTQP